MRLHDLRYQCFTPAELREYVQDIRFVRLPVIKSEDLLDASICAEIRTRIPDTIAWDYNFEPAGANPLTFTVKAWVVYKEANWVSSILWMILLISTGSCHLKNL
ncbi:uncharacterized protein LOC131612452 [Vicia villosa]|uniref:uncharacterized protein LOC131612452 n=1 Tax=Vicia villosa TaxID=3911 RepID=UPI00273BED9C|nr:uncharacterized protein LOC131612452 [Vicia villosa]